MCVCVCVCVRVFSHFSPTRPANSGTCFSLWSPALPGLSAWVILAPDILTQGTGWGHGCVLWASFFSVRGLRGITGCYWPAAVATQWILVFFGHWITRLTLCWRNSRLCLAKQTAPRLWQTLWAFSCTLLPSPERFFSMSVDGLVGVRTKEPSTYICMCEFPAPEEV